MKSEGEDRVTLEPVMQKDITVQIAQDCNNFVFARGILFI